jgi:hypothetical protein
VLGRIVASILEPASESENPARVLDAPSSPIEIVDDALELDL